MTDGGAFVKFFTTNHVVVIPSSPSHVYHLLTVHKLRHLILAPVTWYVTKTVSF